MGENTVDSSITFNIITTNQPPQVPAFQRVQAREDDCAADTRGPCPGLSCFSFLRDFGVTDDRDSLNDLTFIIKVLPSRGTLLAQGPWRYDSNNSLVTCTYRPVAIVAGEPVEGGFKGVEYRPPVDEFGISYDRFQWVAVDRLGAESAVSLAIIDVAEQNDAPIALGDRVSTRESRAVQILLAGYDTEGGDALFIFLSSFLCSVLAELGTKVRR